MRIFSSSKSLLQYLKFWLRIIFRGGENSAYKKRCEMLEHKNSMI